MKLQDTFRAILILSVFAGCLSACGPHMGFSNSGFRAVNSNGSTRVVVPADSRPRQTGPSLSDRARHIQHIEWRQVDPNFSQLIERFQVQQFEWKQDQRRFQVIAEAIIDNETFVFSLALTDEEMHGNKVKESTDLNRQYKLEMKCASKDCSERIFRITRLKDSATAVIRNVRVERILVSSTESNELPIPVVHEYIEVEGGRSEEQIVSRESGQPLPDVLLYDPTVLKNYFIKDSEDAPVLTDSDIPGFSKLTTGEKLAVVADLFIKQNVSIEDDACNRYVLGVLVSAGFTVVEDRDADNFLTVFKMSPDMRGWEIRAYQDERELANRLRTWPEKSAVILQFPRNKHFSRGHVAFLVREGNDLFILESSMNDYGPRKRKVRTRSVIPRKRGMVNVVFPK